MLQAQLARLTFGAVGNAAADGLVKCHVQVQLGLTLA
jgi:hypothetical protein